MEHGSPPNLHHRCVPALLVLLVVLAPPTLYVGDQETILALELAAPPAPGTPE